MSFDFFDDQRMRRIEKSLNHIRKAASTPNPFAPKQADIESLQAEVGELRLLVAVLYQLLLGKDLASEAEIHTLLSSLDAADGKRDGAFDGDPVTGNPRAMLVNPPEDDNPLPKIRV